jgi:hypothetical protein
MKFFISGIAAGAVFLVISFAFSFLVQAVWPYDVLSLGGMRSIGDPVMALFFLYPFVIGIAISYAYKYVSLKGSYLEKGKKFGLLMWLVYGIPSTFIVYTSMNYPIGFHISSLFGNLIGLVVAGIIIARLSK